MVFANVQLHDFSLSSCRVFTWPILIPPNLRCKLQNTVLSWLLRLNTTSNHLKRNAQEKGVHFIWQGRQAPNPSHRSPPSRGTTDYSSSAQAFTAGDIRIQPDEAEFHKLRIMLSGWMIRSCLISSFARCSLGTETFVYAVSQPWDGQGILYWWQMVDWGLMTK